jgi:hypothetical protein
LLLEATKYHHAQMDAIGSLEEDIEWVTEEDDEEDFE